MSDDIKTGPTSETEAGDPGATNPLETLTSLVLDAADAANDSAQTTQEAVSRLSQVVETNEQTTKAIRYAPAIFGAIMLSVGIVMAVVVAMAFSRLDARAQVLEAAVATQTEGIEKLQRTIKDLAVLGADLEKFKGVAEDTTQRAVITLREQVKADRIALQGLEARRINDLIASLRGGIAAGSQAGGGRQGDEPAKLERVLSQVEARLVALERSVAGVQGGLSRLETPAGNRPGGSGAAARPAVAVLSDAQAKDIKATTAEVARLKTEIASLRELIERRTSELQSGVPAIRKTGG
jgi:archaellum component FlaC